MHCSLSSAIALLLAMFIGYHGSSSSSLDANRFSFILKTETRPKSGRATAAAAAAEAGSEWSPTVQQRRRTLVVVVVALMASASGS